jgi:hypothetical protein
MTREKAREALRILAEDPFPEELVISVAEIASALSEGWCKAVEGRGGYLLVLTSVGASGDAVQSNTVALLTDVDAHALVKRFVREGIAQVTH